MAPGDCRHTALLLCRVGRTATGRMRAYVYEVRAATGRERTMRRLVDCCSRARSQGHMEGLARHMLLLSVLLDDALPVKGASWQANSAARHVASPALLVGRATVRPDVCVTDACSRRVRSERVELFLELHGNARLRERSGEYVAARGRLLADVALACSAGERPAAAGGERARLLALFDLSLLRYKERDALVDVFRRRGFTAYSVHKCGRVG